MLIDTAPTATFGANEAPANETMARTEPSIESIDAVIKQLETDPRGKWVVALDNRQTWLQTDSRRLTLAPGERIVIHRTRFGGYLLEKATGSRGIAVKRTN